MSYNAHAVFSYWIGTLAIEKFKEQTCACWGAANTGVRVLRGIDGVSHPRLEVIKFCRYPRSVVGRWNWKVCMQECWSAKIEPKNFGSTYTYIAQVLKAFIQDVYLVNTSFLGSLPFKVVWGRSHSITTMDWRCKGDRAVSKYRQRAAGRRKNRVLCMTSVIFTTLRPRVDFISVYFSALVGLLGFTIEVEMSFLQNSVGITITSFHE